MAKGTTLEHTETERCPGVPQRGKGRRREVAGREHPRSILPRPRPVDPVHRQDPVNRTFAQYSGIDATRLELMRDRSIDVRGFDGLMERLLTEDGTFVIDNGGPRSSRSGATS